ncbi:MAG TPA: thioredoxin family protein [Cyclobacteriaceae bacterium]|nr:thioredoxin family protein [Cyclobacteriaceae bacterium]HMV07637.1 thioredoxin family protein [Cyclobacteriaceae bacterium]HMV89366.1 thioredoxin family protein [Cyclobacteriaceae bacterium]HMW98772.1 thioredoxin family protein [Cyclobacteriaceae bacterium]HMX48595.1 thioredoxin family protein [Cyclobacteriaceae bacterium]
MRKLCLQLMFIVGVCSLAVAQEKEKPNLYNPSADAKADIAAAVKKAAAENKHVILQLGGNWCSWCILYNNLVTTNDTLKTYIANNYVTVHVNYSQENFNDEVFKSLGFPQRFGFPVFVILDGKGNRLHTQNSAYLEKGKGHDPDKVLEFLTQWSPSSLDPKNYRPIGKY